MLQIVVGLSVLPTLEPCTISSHPTSASAGPGQGALPQSCWNPLGLHIWRMGSIREFASFRTYQTFASDQGGEEYSHPAPRPLWDGSGGQSLCFLSSLQDSIKGSS